MTKLSGIVLGNRILCEDIRQEKSNKYILIGVYAGDILVNAIPANISLSFYLEFIGAKIGNNYLSLKISGPGEGQVIINLNYETEKNDTPITVVTPRMEVLLDCEGMIRVEISSDGEDWTSLIEKSVSQKDDLWTLAPIAPMQGS